MWRRAVPNLGSLRRPVCAQSVHSAVVPRVPSASMSGTGVFPRAVPRRLFARCSHRSAAGRVRTSPPRLLPRATLGATFSSAPSTAVFRRALSNRARYERQVHRYVVRNGQQFGGPGGPGGPHWLVRVLQGIAVAGVTIIVLSAGTVMLVIGAAGLAVAAVYIRFMPVRSPLLQGIKATMIAVLRSRKLGKAQAAMLDKTAGRVRTHIELLLQEHPRTVDLAGSSVRVGRLEILEMTPSEGGPPMPGLPATGPHIFVVTAPVTDNTGEVGTLKAKAIAHIPAVDVNSREWEEDGPIARFFKSLFGGDASDEEEVEDTAGNSTILVKKGRRMDTARSSRRQYETSEGTVIEAEFHDK